jgi:hypothetical protein
MKLSDRVKKISSAAYSTRETLLNSYYEAIRCSSLDGDFVECGIGAGSQIAMMALALEFTGVIKRIYAYDSFEGIPMASENDTDQPGIGNVSVSFVQDKESLLISSGIAVHSLENVQRNLVQWGFLYSQGFVFVEGWFQHTLPYNNVEKIALLRLDGDLYESTKVCLVYLFPKLVSGGTLIVDDWALSGCRKACDEYFCYEKVFLKNYQVENSTPMVFIKK